MSYRVACGIGNNAKSPLVIGRRRMQLYSSRPSPTLSPLCESLTLGKLGKLGQNKKAESFEGRGSAAFIFRTAVSPRQTLFKGGGSCGPD
jgi:hypothetical protein